MIENLVIINEAVCYKIYSKKESNTLPYQDAKELNVHHLHPIGSKDYAVVNGFLKHISKLDIDFKTHSIIFFTDYNELSKIVPQPHDPEETLN